MFAEELTRIRESEAKADAIQKKAKLDAKQTLEDARAKADRIVEEAGDRAKETRDALLAEGQKRSEEQYSAFLASVENECSVMAEKARNNENKAIDLIAERIVRASVNR